ncbi:MAG TPA: polysaccharide pyruvyl transferase family protein [Cytophagaceae bacterium]
MAERIYKIGISGSYGGLNMGDEAILQSIVSQLRQSIPVEITVFSRNASDTLIRHSVERAVEVRSLSHKEVKPEIQRLDLFILGGGGILYDADAHYYLREVRIACDLGIPVMLYAIGAGPLTDRRVQSMVRDVLNEVDLITVREVGAQSLFESIGVNKEIIVTADPALLLQPEPLSDENLLIEQLDKKRKLVGISVREPGVAAPDIDEKFYHGLLANAADFIVDRLDADILFIPMEHRVQDLQHSHAVISKMLRPQRASVLKGEYTPGQILSIMSYLTFAVGMRLHFLIFAALQNVPFVALPYASKVSGFIKELGIQSPPLHLVNEGRLIAHIDYIWDTQNQLRVQLAQRLPDVKERAKQTHQLLLKLLHEKYNIVHSLI